MSMWVRSSFSSALQFWSLVEARACSQVVKLFWWFKIGQIASPQGEGIHSIKHVVAPAIDPGE